MYKITNKFVWNNKMNWLSQARFWQRGHQDHQGRQRALTRDANPAPDRLSDRAHGHRPGRRDGRRHHLFRPDHRRDAQAGHGLHRRGHAPAHPRRGLRFGEDQGPRGPRECQGAVQAGPRAFAPGCTELAQNQAHRRVVRSFAGGELVCFIVGLPILLFFSCWRDKKDVILVELYVGFKSQLNCNGLIQGKFFFCCRTILGPK